MIRILVIWNILITALLTSLLVSNRNGGLNKPPLQTGVAQADLVRARRIEVVDEEGRLTAVLGHDTQGLTGGLSLFDPNGRSAVKLGLNDRGYGALYFQAKHTDAKVTVGYFTGNDEAVPLSEEDPEGMWGIRVLRTGFKPPQIFGTVGDDRPISTSP